MGRSENTPLYLKIFQMTKYLHQVIKNFPREYKYSLGDEIQKLAWRCVDEFLEANNCPNSEKFPKILALCNSFDQLKARLRMGYDLKLITEKQFVHLQAGYIAGIGEMLGGWLKWGEKQ